MFGKGGTAPIILCCLVGFGVLLPLGFAVCAILRMDQYGRAAFHSLPVFS